MGNALSTRADTMPILVGTAGWSIGDALLLQARLGLREAAHATEELV